MTGVADTSRAHGDRLPDPVDRWSQYTEVLFDLDLTQDDRRRIKSEYETAGPGSDRPRHLAVAASDSEFQAADEREFALLLKTIQLRSGLTLPKIGELAGIPRSQAYSMVTRGTLPTRFGQVARFAEVCGLPAHEVQRIMKLWLELRQRGHHGDKDKVDVLWRAYLEHLRGNARGCAEEPGRPRGATRRLDEMLKITRGVGVGPGDGRRGRGRWS